MEKEKPVQKALDKKLLKLEHAASLYDINSRTLRDCCILGRVVVNNVPQPFKAVKIGRLWYVLPNEMKKHFMEGLLCQREW